VNTKPAILATLLFVGSQARAAFIDGCSVEGGSSDSIASSVGLVRVGLQKDWREWYRGATWRVDSYWELGLGHWHNDSEEATHSELWDLGFTPTFRLERANPGRWSPFLDAAVGFHLLSHTSVSRVREFGSAFEFGDHIGAGLQYRGRHTYEVGYRFQHVSNGGIAAPNRGINFHIARFGMRF
jgi:hypothetical protein